MRFSQELRKEAAELRRSLQQSKVESQFLRAELRKGGGQSAPPAHFMEEKIQLLKEVRPCQGCCDNGQIQIHFNTSAHTSGLILIFTNGLWPGGEAEVESSGGGAGQS